VGAGPNAVLALGRENYDGWSVNWKEAWQTLTFPGFQRLALRYWKMGLQEQLRSLSKRLFLHSLQELTPGLRLHHLKPAPSGIRAQAVSPDGTLLDDFCLRSAPGVVHVINAPSPAATASLDIAEEVVDRMLQNL
jgi:L-2-hydroxyglutarate oxidase LhgO